MKTVVAAACVLILLSAAELQAQNVTVNGDFETSSITPTWELFGGNTYTQIATFQTVVGVPSLCMKRRPGSPNSNGGISQWVHLIGGKNYTFSASVACVETG